MGVGESLYPFALLARAYGWSHQEMLDLPPRLLGAYARLARQVAAEEALVELDNLTAAVRGALGDRGGRNVCAERRRRLEGLARGQSGTPLASLVRAHLRAKRPELLALFEGDESGPERKLRERLGERDGSVRGG